MTGNQNPYRFLSPLEGDSEADRDLVAATRADDLRVLTNIIASSKSSILYAFSGNGKTSLINAGVIPFFCARGYAAFRTRPRPPWSIGSPVQAFKDCIIRDIQIRYCDLGMVDRIASALSQLAEYPEELIDDIERLKQLSQFRITSPDIQNYLRGYRGDSLPSFIRTLRSLLSPSARILFICDQFEELFVHYYNTPELADFVEQLGQVWSDSSLKVHLLFSLREDWVGSMIAFRSVIPEIFVNYHKLNPIKASDAHEALTAPLSRFEEYEFEDEAVERIIGDLVEAYSVNQKRIQSDVLLAPSSSEDPYIELPALNVVATKLWQTRDRHDRPFSLDHYRSLKDDSPGRRKPDIDTVTPADFVLNRYLEDSLGEIEDSDLCSEEQWRELRIDSLYLLTDRVRHRRAVEEDVLLDEIGQLRPTALDLPVVTKRLLEQSIAPLVARGLVRSFGVAQGGTQYELAHDFAVRSVVKSWQELNRQRIAELAIRSEQESKMKARYSKLMRDHKRTYLLLSVCPVFGLVAAVASLIWGLPKFDSDASAAPLVAMQWIVLIPFAFTFALGLVNRHRLSAILGGISVLALVVHGAWLYAATNSSGKIYVLGSVFFSIGFILFVLLLYPRVLVGICRDFLESVFGQRYFAILWSELVDFLLVVIFAIGALLAATGAGSLVSGASTDAAVTALNDLKTAANTVFTAPSKGSNASASTSSISNLESLIDKAIRDLRWGLPYSAGDDMDKIRTESTQLQDAAQQAGTSSSSTTSFANLLAKAELQVSLWQQTLRSRRNLRTNVVEPITGVATFLVLLSLTALLLARTGIDPGFRLAGFEITTVDGKRPGLGRAFLRQFLFVALCVPSILLGWIAIRRSGYRSNLYDTIARTTPVKPSEIEKSSPVRPNRNPWANMSPRQAG